MTEINIQKIINTSIKEGRQDKEVKNWYASGLGSCMTGRYLERMGVEPDEDFDERTLRVFSVGNMFEDWLISLIGKGHKFETQTRVESKELDVSGKIDLMIDDELVYEVKSKHSKAFWWMTKSGGAQVQHKMQLWLYLYLLDKPKGHIVYLSKDDLAIQEYIVLRDDEDLKKLVLDELGLMNEAWTQQLPPRPLPEKDENGKKHWQNNYCRWHKKCVAQEQYLN